MTTKTITRRRRALALALGSLIALTGVTAAAAGTTVTPPQTVPWSFD
jgi:hypothetical protein